ncbi:HAD-IC family P-type ATPase [Pseudonocardia acaciae]|uniref:HAD-IC family P-type ATPase n=1 Tax=Pseudonocardia acaciae TaxID=551276 RepID=UPI000A7A7192
MADAGWARAAVNRAALDNAAIAWLSVSGEPAGAVLLRDPLRRQAPRTLRRLRAAGLGRLVMLTGDRREPAQEIAIGLDEVHAEQDPADKVASVRAEGRRAATVMVGDGVNDAPALAAATVGVAIGARNATASTEAAGIVLATDRLDRLADAMDIARWSRRIAVQSATVGMGLSLLAMGVAAVGWLRLLPHERAEETELYPAPADPLGGPEATATMSRTHAEIERLTNRIGAHLALARAAGEVPAGQLDDLLACLYGLHTVLRLHFLQEEESYFVLAGDEAPERSPGVC